MSANLSDPPTLDLHDDVNKAIDKSHRLLQRIQKADGRWEATLYYNGWTNATYILTLYAIGIEKDESIDKAVKWLLSHQNSNGSWGVFDFRGSPASLEVTCQVVLSLKVAGYGDMPEVQAGQDFINRNGGVMNVQLITQSYHALFGEYFWNQIPALPIEILLIPENLKFNPLRIFSAWTEIALIPLMALGVLDGYKKISPIQKVALGKAESWILDKQNSDGSWYETILPTSMSVIVLNRLGYPTDHPIIQSALKFMKGLQNEEGYVHRYTYPVWNTVLVALALLDSGLPPDDPSLLRAGNWLVQSQTGANNQAWAFHQNNVGYPDMDDTGFAIAVLSKLKMDTKVKGDAIAKGINWLNNMQNDDGGWAAFSKNQATKTRGVPAAFNEDPSVADIVGHVLVGYGYCGYDTSSPIVQNAIKWLKGDQLEGPWYGRWGVCYTYGTGAALVGLQAVGEDMDTGYVREAVCWLITHQNPDGGWGENYLSYYYPWFAGKGESTVEQTAWALMGLLAAGEDLGSANIEEGCRYLLGMQMPDGHWASNYVDAALWVYKDDLYSTIFPLIALGMYHKAVANGS